MLTRSYDWEGLKATADGLSYELHGFNAKELVESPNVLLEEDGNYGLLEWESEGVFSGHYFFRNADSVNLAKRMLAEAFNKYGAEIVKGLTPLDNLAALRVTEKVGLKDYGNVDTLAGPMRLSMITKQEFCA